MQNSMCVCSDVNGLIVQLGLQHSPHEWRLIIDFTKNQLESMHEVACSISCSNVKETYETTTLLLEAIKYKNHEWQICCDLKVFAFLRGLQGGFNSRDTKNHSTVKEWPIRKLSLERKIEAKLKEDIFVRLQIRKLLKDPTFDTKVETIELAAWSSLKKL
ncbi:hypothetical protein J437_LFUL004023 [Ladona fulva]|uniref:Uncharacterized protein n=1 Tax=Ladona fulva TaxID=123851 RepID=A0A8K0K347_LADFU|nr:hypothetical protein J437_LFUL004023 [Ladona fulva]